MELHITISPGKLPGIVRVRLSGFFQSEQAGIFHISRIDGSSNRMAAIVIKYGSLSDVLGHERRQSHCESAFAHASFPNADVGCHAGAHSNYWRINISFKSILLGVHNHVEWPSWYSSSSTLLMSAAFTFPMPSTSCNSYREALARFLMDLKCFNNGFARTGPTPGSADTTYSCCCVNDNGFLSACQENSRPTSSCSRLAMILSSEAVSFAFLVCRMGMP